MQTFVDPDSPRSRLAVEQLPRGAVRFPAHVVDALEKAKAGFSPEIFTEEYERRSLECQTLAWYYAGLPVAYKSLPDGIEVLAVGWQETAKYANAGPAIKVVQP